MNTKKWEVTVRTIHEQRVVDVTVDDVLAEDSTKAVEVARSILGNRMWDVVHVAEIIVV